MVVIMGQQSRVVVGLVVVLVLAVGQNEGARMQPSYRTRSVVPTPVPVPAPAQAIVGSDSTTCQCGVFLLGTPPLEFSADAKPVLAGKPVSTNCTSPQDRTQCSTICRQLVQAMSSQDSPLVQTVVVAATRTLACQRFNTSTKVPLPRIHVASSWRLEDNEQKRDVLSDPRWLGGFYRWCDSHWVYAGVSVDEPLCCINGLPSKCPDAVISQRSMPGTSSNRNPRLIIKKRPEDDISSEEQENLENDVETTGPSTAATTTVSDDSAAVSSETGASFEKIDPLPVREPPGTTKLNSTILAEAFQFVGALMRSLGMGEVAEGISTVLPTSAATELLKRVDVGGWVGKYQDRYVRYGREFNFGYCYLEYGLYNVAAEGLPNMISRVFGGGAKTNRRIRRDAPIESNVTLPASAPRKKKKPQATRRQSVDDRQGSGGGTVPNLLNMASMFMQMANAGSGGESSGGGDKVNVLLQNALPMLGQFATSPMVQGAVSNLVTNFLTPPDKNQGDNGGQRPPKPGMNRPSDNELEAVPSHRPTNQESNQGNRPPNHHQEQQESGLTSMFGQIMQTYLKHVLSPKNPPPSPPPSRQPPTKSTPVKHSSSSSSSTAAPAVEEQSDIVDTICEVAKPFFISYTGVVPGIPGFGQLNIAERTGRIRDDTLTYDPDPGSSLSDLVFGSVNLPQTGSTIYDFGNRIAFALGRANDPTQGLYCLKQYGVNKLWDGFRVGVKALFK